ncbi:hypothetical protein ACFSCV_15440 [Methylopila henanensis]|uniref:Uncharacterized protein n=1 Tax=Methylopila henanensis TaxID=873516 RepID=A0ABW4KA80_9HYPH
MSDAPKDPVSPPHRRFMLRQAGLRLWLAVGVVVAAILLLIYG